jgi:hypothetical protein
VNGNGSLMRLVGDDETTARPAIVDRVRDEVRTGRYRPPVDDVAERLAAFLMTRGSDFATHADAA